MGLAAAFVVKFHKISQRGATAIMEVGCGSRDLPQARGVEASEVRGSPGDGGSPLMRWISRVEAGGVKEFVGQHRTAVAA